MRALIKNNSGVIIKDLKINSLEDGEVLIENKFVGISPLDFLVSKGLIQPKTIILGSHCVGKVVESNSKKYVKDDLVMINPKFEKNFLGFNKDGVIADYFNIDDNYLININNYKNDNLFSINNIYNIAKILSSIDYLKNKKIGIVTSSFELSLTKMVLSTFDINCEHVDFNDDKTFDVIIKYEYSNNLNSILSRLNSNSYIILGCDYLASMPINFNSIIEKNVTIINQHLDFDKAFKWYDENKKILDSFDNQFYTLDNWHEAFWKTVSIKEKRFYIQF